MSFHCVIERRLTLWVSTEKNTREEALQEIQEVTKYGGSGAALGGYETELDGPFPATLLVRIESAGAFLGTLMIRRDAGTNYYEWS